MKAGESLVDALHRELGEEIGLFPDGVEMPLEGPVAIVDSIAPERSRGPKHVVHVIFAGDLDGLARGRRVAATTPCAAIGVSRPASSRR